MDLELRWIDFYDLFTSRTKWAAGGEYSHCNMGCATLNHFCCGDPQSIIPMNFLGQTLAARGGYMG